MLRNLRHRARTITLRTEFWMENGTQKWFEIQAREVWVASKIDSGGFEGGQGAKKLFLKALGTPWGLAWGGDLGVQSRSKPVMEALPRRNWIRSAVWRGYGTSRKRILKAFLKSPVDEMMCLRQNNGKVRIFKNTFVFTVRLNIDVVEDSQGLNVKRIDFELGSWKPSRSLSWPPHLLEQLSPILAAIYR
mgnify:CR=1 FL=1